MTPFRAVPRATALVVAAFTVVGLGTPRAARGESLDAGLDGAAATTTTTAVVADGAYRLLEPRATDEAMGTAIDAVIGGLHPSMREPFRAQIGATMRAPRRFTIAHRDDAVDVALDGHVLTAPATGVEARQAGPEGRPVRVVHRQDGAAFVQEQRTGQFTLIRRFVVDGSAVRIDAELRSGMLPRPVTTSARYASDAAP